MPTRLRFLAVGSVVLLAACADPLIPEGVTGTYDLRTVNGVPVPLPGLYTQVSGRVTLADNGRFERRVSFRVDSAGTLHEIVYSATYRVRGSMLEVAVRTDGSPLVRTWRSFGEVADGTLTLPIPLPADGYDIEVYERR